jgi:peptidyl-prolyl cis-trans isomerase D
MGAKNGISKVLVWILLALLIVGIAGFGTVNFSGSVQKVASVGDKTITVSDYARAIQSEMRAIEGQTGQPLTFQQAQAFGVPQQALAQLITTRAMDYEAGQLGLSVGDQEVADQIQAIQAFKGPDGNFDRSAYRYALQNIDLSEADFEEQLREESARTLLQGAVLAGTAMPESYIDTLLGYVLEQRSFTWGTLENGDLDTGRPVPEEADLRAHYDANIAKFTHPEQRRITYAWMTPEMIVDSVDIDEATLQAAYDERSDQYNQPERRLVEQLVFPSEDAAAAAKARIDAGETSFEDEVEARGLALLDIDLGDVSIEDLEDAGEAVFAAEVGDLVGPAPSTFGAALFRVNGVLSETSLPFIAARDDLKEELAADRARRVIEGQIEPLQDLLAAGATVEELAEESQMELGTILYAADSDETIAGYEAFRAAALAAQTDDFPEVLELEDGGLFALRLDEIVAPAPIPFEDARDAVEADWTTQQIAEALTAQADAAAQQMNEGRTFAAVGIETVTSEENIRRRDYVEALPITLISTVFDMTQGETRAIVEGGRAILVQLDSIADADRDSEDAQALESALKDQAAGDVAQDLFNAMAADIQSRVGISYDQQAINAVHSNFQ